MASIPSALALSTPLPGCPLHCPPPAATATSSFLPPSVSFSRFHHPSTQTRHNAVIPVRSLSLDFSGSFFDDDDVIDDEDEDFFGPSAATAMAEVAQKEEIPCPPGLRRYETMAVLRPDMSEDERIALTQKYEELLVAGGGMYIEVFNRGVIPLAYDIQRKNRAGETNTYMDGIYMLFTYFTKPESMTALTSKLMADDNVIRSTSFKVRKRKY